MSRALAISLVFVLGCNSAAETNAEVEKPPEQAPAPAPSPTPPRAERPSAPEPPLANALVVFTKANELRVLVEGETDWRSIRSFAETDTLEVSPHTANRLVFFQRRPDDISFDVHVLNAALEFAPPPGQRRSRFQDMAAGLDGELWAEGSHGLPVNFANPGGTISVPPFPAQFPAEREDFEDAVFTTATDGSLYAFHDKVLARWELHDSAWVPLTPAPTTAIEKLVPSPTGGVIVRTEDELLFVHPNHADGKLEATRHRHDFVTKEPRRAEFGFKGMDLVGTGALGMVASAKGQAVLTVRTLDRDSIHVFDPDRGQLPALDMNWIARAVAMDARDRVWLSVTREGLQVETLSGEHVGVLAGQFEFAAVFGRGPSPEVLAPMLEPKPLVDVRVRPAPTDAAATDPKPPSDPSSATIEPGRFRVQIASVKDWSAGWRVQSQFEHELTAIAPWLRITLVERPPNVHVLVGSFSSKAEAEARRSVIEQIVGQGVIVRDITEYCPDGDAPDQRCER